MLNSTTLDAVRKEVRSTIAISLPLIVSQLIYSSSTFISTAMISRLGEDELAASVLVSSIWMTMSVMFLGILNSVSLLISHQYGAKNNQAISEIMGKSVHLGFIIFLLMTLTLSSMPFILTYSHQPAHVIQLATQYVYSLLWITPGLVTLVILEQFLTGIHRVKLVLRISFMIVPLEIPLIWALIFGKLGLPTCGIAGIGYGFAISYSIAACVLLVYLHRSSHFHQYGIFQSIFSAPTKWLKELIRIGVPMGLMYVIEVGTFTIATFWIAQFGTTMLAAHQIVMQYMGMIITTIFSMSQAVTIRIGHAVGKQDSSGIQLAIATGMMISFLFISLIAVAFYAVPHYFVKLDINIQDVNNYALLRDASTLLIIAGISMMFDNFRIISFGALRGLKDTHFPMYTSFVSFGIIGLSAAWLLGFVLHDGGKGIWWGLVIGIASGAIVLLIRLHYLLQRIDVKKLLSVN